MMSRLEDIGFYTLCDSRVNELSAFSPMWRCELILTDRCNFNCPYCRGLRKDIQGSLSYLEAEEIVRQWADQGLKNIRFSGGEPLLWHGLLHLVEYARYRGIERVAISSNGSQPLERYKELIASGVNDFSISFDACCAAGFETLAGSNTSNWDHVSSVIRELSKLTYVTVGVVLTDANMPQLGEIVQYAHDLGVADIRIIPAAQMGPTLVGTEVIPQHILDVHPILKYRVDRIKEGLLPRSIQEYGSHRCFIPIDDSVVAGGYHFPCVIYMREGG